MSNSDVAPLTSSMRPVLYALTQAKLEPVQIVSQPSEQCLNSLHFEGSAWGSCRQFAFYHREDALYQPPPSIQPTWEGGSHLGPVSEAR
jgi:hypothetical protein